jgi:glycosyltransferase involved in cell wall biosynthesis
MLRVFHLQNVSLDETSRLFMEGVLSLTNDVRVYGQERIPPAKQEPLPSFDGQGVLAVNKRLYRHRHLSALISSFEAQDRLLFTDWASCMLFPAQTLRNHRAIQLVSALPPEQPASWRHSFVKAASEMRLIVPNAILAQTMTSWGIPTERVIQIPPPFETQIPAQPAMATPGDFLAGTVSRLDQNQGLETLIQAIQSCTEIIPPLKLFIIGDGPDKRRILWLIDQTHLRPRVQVAANDHDYRRFLHNLSICVAPNHFDPGFNPVIAHALARGLPVIATDLPGHRDMIDHGKTGLLYTPGNSHMLAQHMVNLYTHPEWMAHYKKIGPELVRSRWGTEEFLTKIEAVLSH